MIVLAILVTMTAIAWPKITRRLQQIGPREAAITIKAQLADARERAILDGEPWVFRIERASDKYEYGPVSALRAQEQVEFQGALASGPAGASANSSFAVDALPSSANALGQAPVPTVTAERQLSGAADPSERIRRENLPAGLVFDDGVAHSTQEANAVRIPGIQNQLPNSQLSSLTQPAQAGQAGLPQLTPSSGVVPQGDPAFAQPSQLSIPTAPTGWKYVVVFQPDGRATESEIRLKDVATEATIRLRVRRLTGGVTIDKVEYRKPIDTQLLPGQAEQVPLPVDPNSRSPLDSVVPPQAQPMGGLQ